jgi:hypothetical protein
MQGLLNSVEVRETGLYYYGARYLDAKAGRWLSADPALGEYIPEAPVNEEARKRNGALPGMGGVYNMINAHLYHYAGNNPVKYTDPDGKSPLLFSTVGLFTGGLASAVVSIKAGENVTDTLINVGIGMIGGAVAGFSLSVGQSVVAGSVVSSVSNIIIQKTTGDKEVGIKQVIASAALGGVFGGLGKVAEISVIGSSSLAGLTIESGAELGSVANIAITTLGSAISACVTTLLEDDH